MNTFKIIGESVQCTKNKTLHDALSWENNQLEDSNSIKLVHIMSFQ